MQPFRILGAAALVASVALVVRLSPGPESAAAEPAPAHGFHGTVLGWTSWYGSYAMGELGETWCIDHGSRAPDPAFGYMPVTLDDRDASTKNAMAWIVGRYGPGVDDVNAAAMMLALHDLAGAIYPYGRLDVDALDAGSLAGFGGAEAEVLARARQYKGDGLAHAGLAGPFRLTATASHASPTGEALVTVQLTDGNGAPMAGEALALRGDEVAFANGTTMAALVTGADGLATAPVRLAGPTGRVDVATELPDLALHAYGSTTTSAQRVVQPVRVTLTASLQIDVPPPGSIVVQKHGDDEAYLPVEGARFAVVDGAEQVVAEATTGDRGAAEPMTVPAGHYRVVETSAPAGYATAGPWEVDVSAGTTTTVEAVDAALRGAVEIVKRDAATGAPVVGAGLDLSYDADNSGDDYETVVVSVASESQPVTIADLLPGRYELRETSVPEGYSGPADPVRFAVGPGEVAKVQVINQPSATVAFWKIAPDDDSPIPSRAGAVFEVAAADGTVAGSCITDEVGRCTLSGRPLAGGARYCWREVVAPPGWLTAEPGCFDTGGAGSVLTIRVNEPLAPPTVRALPRTGAMSGPLTALGAGLVLLGGALMCLRPRDQ